MLFIIQSKAQLDTLNYLKKLETNKAFYICQPFSGLLADMKINKPKMIWTTPIHGIRKMVSATVFCFTAKPPLDYTTGLSNNNAKCLSVT